MTPTEVRRVANIIAGLVAETPTGAPSGILYSGLMGLLDLDEYQSIVGALEQAGLIETRCHVLYPTPKLAAAAAGSAGVSQ